MRKIIVFIHSTVNGIVTGDPSQDKTNFMVWTTEASIQTGSEWLLKAMSNVDTILLGRGTYEDFKRKWPLIKDWGPVSDVVSALGQKVNKAQKLVVTGAHPHEQLVWGEFAAPQQITGANITEQIVKLKNGKGGDIMIFGSPILVRALTAGRLIDEYQLQVHPVVANVGEQLFDDRARIDFALVSAQPLADGSIVAIYKPAKVSQN